MQSYSQRGTVKTVTVDPPYTASNPTSCRAILTCNAAHSASEYGVKSKSRICSGAMLTMNWPSQLLAIQTGNGSIVTPSFQLLDNSNIAFEEYGCIFAVIKPGDWICHSRTGWVSCQFSSSQVSMHNVVVFYGQLLYIKALSDAAWVHKLTCGGGAVLVRPSFVWTL